MSTNILRIEGELTIFRAMELKPVLLAVPPVDEVDLSGVTDLDTAGVQLLMLAKKTALAASATSSWWRTARRCSKCLSCSTWQLILVTTW
jgi:anti-anti-sigma regulatory factor